jgi:hypothetical protein
MSQQDSGQTSLIVSQLFGNIFFQQNHTANGLSAGRLSSWLLWPNDPTDTDVINVTEQDFATVMAELNATKSPPDMATMGEWGGQTNLIHSPVEKKSSRNPLASLGALHPAWKPLRIRLLDDADGLTEGVSRTSTDSVNTVQAGAAFPPNQFPALFQWIAAHVHSTNNAEGSDEVKPYLGIRQSKGLAELIEQASKTGKPIRVELDADSMVILKIRQGQVAAEFSSSDPAMALYLKQHLASLKAECAEKQLPVSDLLYREHSGKHSQQQHPSDADRDS